MTYYGQDELPKSVPIGQGKRQLGRFWSVKEAPASKGVWLCCGNYTAEIWDQNKVTMLKLGMFATQEEAYKAYERKANELIFGEEKLAGDDALFRRLVADFQMAINGFLEVSKEIDSEKVAWVPIILASPQLELIGDDQDQKWKGKCMVVAWDDRKNGAMSHRNMTNGEDKKLPNFKPASSAPATYRSTSKAAVGLGSAHNSMGGCGGLQAHEPAAGSSGSVLELGYASKDTDLESLEVRQQSSPPRSSDNSNLKLFHKVDAIPDKLVLTVFGGLLQSVFQMGQLKMSGCRRCALTLATWVAVFSLFCGLVQRLKGRRGTLATGLIVLGLISAAGVILFALPVYLPKSTRLPADIVAALCSILVTVVVLL